ncbi:MAG: DMT family transporter, partial [Gemmatimonadales bacterium]
ADYSRKFRVVSRIWPSLFFGMTKPPSAADWLFILIPGLIWGASFLFIAEGLEAVGPNGVTFVRIAVGFLTLACFPQAWKTVARSEWLAIAALGVLWLAFPLSMFPYAEQHVSSALTGMLNGGTSLFAVIVAAVIARKLPPAGMVVGLAIGIAGVTLVALPAVGAGSSSSLGVGMILIALVSYGFALNVARPLQVKHGAIPVIWRAQMVAVVLTAPFGVRDLLHAHWTLAPLLSLLALGAFGTAIAHVMMTVAAGRLGADRASAATFLMPPVALLLGVLVRGESVYPISIVGGAVCLTGAWLMNRSRPVVVPTLSQEEA